ncbi:SUPPRESSOR OF GAMMA RESPONSE 1 isoform X1 [Cajanus cajan]|uniref:SUPPRESSOR OF GAMMA RESPONSE 1 isoform X1 n=1 Tax=Cajanus cajan TaxID=3821 RepID=UPI00098DD4D5|nr:SUPPRESSOR OF GAMMA RESPONSE 1 isoform X1 [Cajanus cajan]
MTMAGTSWLVDKSRIATKIMSASGSCGKVIWKSNPARACPNCEHVIDNSDVAQEWPGLPKGVKFDPSDQEIIWHLLAKVGAGNSRPHPFIDEFITTLEADGGICYTHPQHLPGVKQDGNASHFFHRAIKAYNTGSRKRRKICDQDFGDVRWHKTGRTKPVIFNGVQKGCKKIMVLYVSLVRGGKSEKTNWVMHQYHLGTQEDEKDGEYVISKVFYQQLQVKFGENDDQDIPEITEATLLKVDPVTPKSVTPEPPRIEKQCSNLDLKLKEESRHIPQHPQMDCIDDLQADCEDLAKDDLLVVDTQNNKGIDNIENNAEEDSKWWDSESQNLLSSQQLVEALFLCDDLLQSQSPSRDGENEHKKRPSLSVYAHLGPEHLKKDIEECQNLVLDTTNVEPETVPSELRLSQLDFSTQDSFISWGDCKAID